MNLLECILTANDCYKTGETIKPTGVMVHSTGANNPWLRRYVQPLSSDTAHSKLIGQLGKNGNRNSWNRSGLFVCVHAFVGKLADGSVASVKTLPWNCRGWHAGRGKKGSANDTHISFEICEDGLTDRTYFTKVYNEAVELTAMLCKEFDLDPLADGVVICHSEGYKRGVASNHGDVLHWWPKHGKDMDDFRADVKKAMGIVAEDADLYPARLTSGYYRVRKSWKDKASQKGAFRVLASAKDTADKNPGYYVFTDSGVAIYPAAPAQEIKAGSTVKVKQGAKTYTGSSLASFVYTRTHTVKQVSGDRVVITYNGVVVAAVHKDNLILV